MSVYTEHNSDPLVCTHTDILSDEECKHFIEISKASLKRSLVSMNNKGIESKGRTSLNTWIKHNHDQITLSVAERISSIVQLPLENAESFQIIYYDVNCEYKQHYDSWKHDGSEKTKRCMKWGGARLKTALVYLNDVETGGGTRMTKLNITIEPKKGKLLIFNNCYENNNSVHPHSEHCGMPVIKGEKYAFNLWFKETKLTQLYSDFNPTYYDKNKS